MKTLSLPQLPAMKCDEGCGDCCGIVMCSSAEAKTIVNVINARGIKPVRQGSKCPLYIDGKCSVYEVRPTVCKLFGHVEKMPCSRGYNTNVSDEIAHEYHKVMARGGTGSRRLLHMLVYTEDEFFEILKNTVGEPERTLEGQKL